MDTKTGTDKSPDPDLYENIQCDQFGIDSEGNPIAEGLTGTGSDAGLKEHSTPIIPTR